MNSTMHDFARGAAPSAGRRSNSPSVNPATPSDPIRSISRRETRSHNRIARDWIVNMV
jgi:hypothetical protein